MTKVNVLRKYTEDITIDYPRSSPRNRKRDSAPLELPRSCMHLADVNEIVSLYQHLDTKALVMEGSLISSEKDSFGEPRKFLNGRYRKSRMAMTYAANGRILDTNSRLVLVSSIPYYTAIMCVHDQRLP